MKEQFTQIIKSNDLKDITLDLVEKALDSAITNDILREVPILKSIIAAKNIYTSYTDRIFIKKAMSVLMELGEIDCAERVKLLSDLDEKNENGAERILMAIDSMETTKKCKVFGRLCKLKALGEVDKGEFLRLTKLIQDAYLDDLSLVNDFNGFEKKEIYQGDYYAILSLGLIYQEPSEQLPIQRNFQYTEHDPEFKGGDIKFFYLLSDLGRLLNYFYLRLFSLENEEQ